MEYQNVDLKDYGCLFVEYKDILRPIFYIRLPIFFKLLDLHEIQKHKILEQLVENEDEEEIYVLKVEDEGLPFIPIQKDIMQQLVYEGNPIENLNTDQFVEKYKEKYNFLTKEYVEKALIFLHNELKKTEHDLKKYEILQQVKDVDLDDVSSISSVTDSEEERQ
jgi:hypothetical protein